MTEVHPLDPLVQRWSKHAELSAEDRDAILDLPFSRRKFGKEAYMVREGQHTSECSLLLKGFAFRQKLLRNGSRQIISFHIPTEFVDLQNGLLGLADHSVQSLDGSEAAAIPRASLIELADTRPPIRVAMWVDTLIDASIFREWVVNVGRRDARARIAHLLCELVERLRKIGAGQEGIFDFPLTQEQLADATGLTAVHTNRTLQSLRRDGLIRLDARSLTVLDWDRLREVADFDELYLHQEIDHKPRAELDYAEQPQDEDQEQDSAETDIHVVLRILFCSYNNAARRPVPIVTGPFVVNDGYDFTAPVTGGFA